jgi:cytochrome c oxidase assembly protein subunit 15
LVPDGLLAMQPAWRNFFENAMTVQFDHRVLAYAIAAVVALHAYIVRSSAALLLLAAILLQTGLGVWTLLAQVPLGLGLIHQGGALIVLAAALWNLHTMLSRSPVPDRR